MSDINTIFQNGVKATPTGGNLVIEANPDNDTLNVTGDGHLAVAHTDAAANVPSLRTLGSGAQQAAGGAHTHALSALTQSGAARAQVPKRNGSAWTPQDESRGLTAPALEAVAAIPWVRWFKADALTGLSDGDPVDYWANSAAILTPATQATSGSQPLYKTNIVNGLPVVRFDGVDDYLRTVGRRDESRGRVLHGRRGVAVADRSVPACHLRGRRKRGQAPRHVAVGRRDSGRAGIR